ncbi:hypothetical protein [Methylobacterium mesophilicum]|uniref:hypothetical protein n=1 Tax=Methylobacterium mesophilicum TaxID=39956 RepID=UPI002F2C3EAD
MRFLLAIPLLVLATAGASAGEPLLDGPVVAGGFGMGGSDYYGDVRSRMPFTGEAPPRPVGMADIVRVRAARARAATASRRKAPHRPSHRG